MGLSLRAYAAHRSALGLPGGSHTAVRKAIQSGRITPESDGTIEPARADAQWAGQTDPSRQRGLASAAAAAESARATASRGPASRPVPQSAIDSVHETLAETGQDPEPVAGGQVTFMRARLATEVLKAQLQKERLKRERGEVVDRARAVAMVFDLARRERDAWIGWPARVSANMAAELGVDPHQLEQVLDWHLREHLATLAEVKVELR
jgi:hypothetical protein